MDFQDFIRRFDEACGGAGLEAGDDGHVAFTASGIELHLQQVEEAGTVVAYCSVLELPPTSDEALLRALLEMNYLYQGTRGATLSLKPESNGLLLADKMPHFAELDFDDVMQVLTNLLNSAKALQAMLSDYRSAAPSASYSEEPPFGGLGTIRI